MVAHSALGTIRMPLTLAEIDSIQADAMADDVEIDFEKMRLWTHEQAAVFFETGEEPPPPWEPEPYLMGRLEREGLAHLKEPLREQTVAGLVELITKERPKFLPTLQRLGIAKLADRQQVRDVIKCIANPPVGSEDKLREEHKEEFALWPYAVVQGESYIVEAEVFAQVSQLPAGRPLKRYRVRTLAKGAAGISLHLRRASGSGVVGSSGLIYENGDELYGDEESWSVSDPNLRVHVYALNKVQPSMGFLQGWVNFVDLLPLDENGEPPLRAPVSDFSIQRKIQDYFEDGYYQLSVCRAISQGIKAKPQGMTLRQALDLIFMKVRGPALIKLGYTPNTKGLNEYMASINDDYSTLSDDDFAALMDAHNRIVALMGGLDPRTVPDARAMRQAGTNVDLGAAFEAEEEAAEEIEIRNAEEGGEDGAVAEAVEAEPMVRAASG